MGMLRLVWKHSCPVPFHALRHQMCLVGLHNEVELIDEVLWLNETLEPAHHRHFAVLQHYHGQEWVGVLSQSLGHWDTPRYDSGKSHPFHREMYSHSLHNYFNVIFKHIFWVCIRVMTEVWMKNSKPMWIIGVLVMYVLFALSVWCPSFYSQASGGPFSYFYTVLQLNVCFNHL